MYVQFVEIIISLSLSPRKQKGNLDCIIKNN